MDAETYWRNFCADHELSGGLFDGLTLAEWRALCTAMERAMRKIVDHPEVLWRYGPLDDCRDVHGDLMLTWHGLAEMAS